jgi:small subunit ribosomal protein S6
MRRYELMLLLRPDLEDDKLQAAVEKVTRAIVNGGGSLSKVSPWGKRRLAYDIGRHREASYFLIHFDIEPSQVREIERGLLISEEILRHLVTVLEDRGPVEDVAPAVAPRAAAETDLADAPDDGDSDFESAAPSATADSDFESAAPSATADSDFESAAPLATADSDLEPAPALVSVDADSAEPEPEPELVAADVTGEPSDEERTEA